MTPKTYTTEEALELLSRVGIRTTKPTLINWLTKFELGHQIGGKGGNWIINAVKFDGWLEKQTKALGGI